MVVGPSFVSQQYHTYMYICRRPRKLATVSCVYNRGSVVLSPGHMYSHEVCARVLPVGLVLGTHLHGLLPQLTTVRVLETTQDKHNTGLVGVRGEERKGGRERERRWVGVRGERERERERDIEEGVRKGEESGRQKQERVREGEGGKDKRERR